MQRYRRTILVVLQRASAIETRSYLRYAVAVLAGFTVIFIGSVHVPGLLLPIIFGPYPMDGNVPFLRIFTDFCLSFAMTVFGGYLAASYAPSKPLVFGFVSGMLYFCLSAYLYSGYSLEGSEWIYPIFMLIKVPLAAYLGALLFQKYSDAEPKEDGRDDATG